MKASLKFREDQKPLLRAKVPLNILGFPFQSGVAVGESKELSLQLGTFFESGPSLKMAYRPNDTWNPFSFIVKTGTGAFGSPSSSSMMMSAEFNLVGKGNPSFFLHFKPRFGDFSIKKSQSSLSFAGNNNTIGSQSNDVASGHDGSIELVERPVVGGYAPENGLFSGKKMAILQVESHAAGLVEGLCSGAEVNATTSLPLMNKAVVRFRWGVRFPAELRNALKDEGLGKKRMAGISVHKIPLLVMDKISIEHVDNSDLKGTTKVDQGLNSQGTSEVADMCVSVKRQLEFLQAENGLLKNSVDDLLSEFAGRNSYSHARAMDSGKYREIERSGNNKPLSGGKNDRRGGEKKSSEFNGYAGKGTEGDANEELKKALKGATGSGL